MTLADDRDPRLIWTQAGEPRSGRYDDVYFSAEDGLAEARTVFLQGCDLPDAWADRSRFTVAELGFGSGLNIIALLDLWRRTQPPAGRLHIFSIEGFPLKVDEARRALANWPEVADLSEALLAHWPLGTPGFHRIDLPPLHATIDLAVGEVAWALSEWTGRADAWFLDGFAPAVNPEMWSDAVLDLIADRSAPDARLATFTVAGAVRRGLSQRGFQVDKRPGHGRKRERLEARRPGPAINLPAPTRVVVIGAGIAGASVVRAFNTQGITPILIEAETPGAGGSGFPSALVTPRFDLGDTEIAGLFSQGLDRAAALYTRVPGGILSRGVLQLPGSQRDDARFTRIADQSFWPQARLRLLSSEDTSAVTSEPTSGPALAMDAAFTVAPATVLDDWLSGATAVPGQAHAIATEAGGWRVIDAAGRVLAQADAVVVCAGAGTQRLLPELALSPVRGQAEWVRHPAVPAVAWGGYVAPTADGFLFGATHDRGETDSDVRAEDSARNMATLSARLSTLAAGLDPATIRSRAAVRATTRDRLPVVGAVPGPSGLFVLGGLGSRGFCLAPLLAEHLVALISDLPSPLPAGVADRLSPSRRALIPLVQPITVDQP